MYTLSPSKSIKRRNYGEFLKDKNVLLMYTTVLSAYKYAPNLESLLTQQYVCVMCTLLSDNTCVFARFYSVKNANTQLIWSSAEHSTPLISSLMLEEVGRENKDNKEPTIIGMLDVKSAFDVVRHANLIRRLYHYGVSKQCILMIDNLYRNATTKIKWKG